MAQSPVKPAGPPNAPVMIVGEAPGEDEISLGTPFVGASGAELCRMLKEAGIRSGTYHWNSLIGKSAVDWSPSECFVTNVARVRPPDNDIKHFICSTKQGKPVTARKSKLINHKIHKPLRDLWVTEEIIHGYNLLRQEIDQVKPTIIIPVGNVSMWALTGKWGIKKWRGSMLFTDFTTLQRSGTLAASKVIPTIHPAAILREWSNRAVAVNDLRRASHFRDGRAYPKPKWNFIIRPTYETCCNVLDQLLVRLDGGERLRISFDIETRTGHIACAGISWSRVDAICIPFMCEERAEGYFSLDEETGIVYRLYRLLTHARADVIGQNIIYDSQYTWRHWKFVPRVVLDTMISQHACFSALPKGLAYLASMYCEYYVYWKDEGKQL